MSLTAVQTQKERAIHPCRKFEGHAEDVYGVTHLPDERIMTCSIDGSLRVWNLDTGGQIGNDWRDGENEVESIALSPDGKKVVSGGEDGVVKVWDMDRGRVITKWTGHRSSVTSVSWSRDGTRIMSGCWDGTARVWDVESGKTILDLNTELRHIYTYGAIYSPDETMIATGGKDKKDPEFLKIWDAKTGKLVKNLKGHTKSVTCLAWTPNGCTLISGSQDHSIRTWNTTTWQQLAILIGHTGVVLAIAISPNGRILVSASGDKTARLWNLQNGHLVGSPLQHPDSVNCLSFSTDGKLLATGCSDNNAYTWDIPAIEGGLDELLVNDIDKSMLNAVATRRNRRRENAHRIPPRFFDDSPHHAHSTASRRPLPSSTRQRHSAGPTFLDHVSSLFQHTHDNEQSTGPQLHPMGWVRNPFSSILRRGQDEDIDFQDRHAAVAHTPFAHGNPRNYSAREARMKAEKEKKKKKEEEQWKKLEVEKARDAKNASASSSQLLQSSVAPKSEAAQTQPTSQLVSSSFTPAVAAPPVSTKLTSPRLVGRWTRFRLYICCLSGQYIDDHE